MLDVILQILSVLGILLLVLLGLLLTVLLLVLFFPVTYRAEARRTPEETRASARAKWLFGLLRARYAYPEPGKLTVRLLWFRLYETGADDAETSAGETPPGPPPEQESIRPEAQGEDRGREEEPKAQEQKSDAPSRKSKKITNIKYTIAGIYDKIKQIWKNISYYAELFREEDTRLLLSHARRRLWKILKSIRPRRLKADILFGTGAPDTTGYLFGAYGAISPVLGPGVMVTPDFERAVLQGELEAAGHVTVAVILWQLLRVALDKRLWQLVDRLKGKDAAGKKKR